MEVEQSWAVLDQIRNSELAELVEVETNEDYFCRHCGGAKIFHGQDEHGGSIDLPTCTVCGAMDDIYVSNEPEWRTGADHEGGDPCRVGAPENLDHFSQAWNMGTLIKKQWSSNRSISTLLLRQLQSNVNHKDRSLWHAYNEMDRIGTVVLSLPSSIMYDAKIKYRKFNQNVLTRGAVRNGIKANCIFQACREHGVARTTQEIADAFKIPTRDISRTFELYQGQNPEKEVHVIGSADLIGRFFNSVTCVPEQHRGRVRMKITQACKSLDDSVTLMGRTPKAVACAVMYVMLLKLGFAVSKAEICKICDVSGPTLTKIESIVKSELK
ncbi:putative transcription initiation factor IIB [Yellowstone lake phycodnavirus 2]|uniref:putative transcription initiation factor IIB n=1 Tax=Yellowstone lake phycodnavirus 2 TaxID=1586714 RepID=UPI0006EBD662|nr:putative transcription initiation factor IIB [Yellowstone lake phycodnavirus 2]BAT22394.1 putative transcription initiation factor IIB [Yellowstone lake phycodnavirus 2]